MSRKNSSGVSEGNGYSEVIPHNNIIWQIWCNDSSMMLWCQVPFKVYFKAKGGWMLLGPIWGICVFTLF